MAAIDRSVVQHAASLARIALTGEEVVRFTAQLAQVLTAMDRLKAVDTADIPPSASILPLMNVTREDEVRPGLSLEDAFRNVPPGGRDGDLFRVQAALEERPP